MGNLPGHQFTKKFVEKHTVNYAGYMTSRKQ